MEDWVDDLLLSLHEPRLEIAVVLWRVLQHFQKMADPISRRLLVLVLDINPPVLLRIQVNQNFVQQF